PARASRNFLLSRVWGNIALRADGCLFTIEVHLGHQGLFGSRSLACPKCHHDQRRARAPQSGLSHGDPPCCVLVRLRECRKFPVPGVPTELSATDSFEVEPDPRVSWHSGLLRELHARRDYGKRTVPALSRTSRTSERRTPT